eukprot:TRINITY_DN20600_c0_g1_i1.p1 TRINITY_DN20600_c0_g1~~TRINITY_DN20600_c0_g1_i1.p1  ORF type:complete len:291 (-),score=55.06 TRINITY_DN20600_c0_g1_i1:104-892(-)
MVASGALSLQAAAAAVERVRRSQSDTNTFRDAQVSSAFPMSAAPTCRSSAGVANDANAVLAEFTVAMPHLVKHFPPLERYSLALRNALLFLAALAHQPLPPPPPTLVDASEASLRTAAQSTFGRRKMTVVLDLDETLVHCRLECLKSPRHNLTVHFEESPAPGFVYVRPFAQLFLTIAAQLFDLAAFTASSRSYADQVLDFLDPDGKLFCARLYRQHCTEVGGAYLKDLRQFGKPMSHILLVDNSPASLALCPDNGVIVSWR